MKPLGPKAKAAVLLGSVCLHALPVIGLWQWVKVAREVSPAQEAFQVEMIRLAAPPEPPSERPPGPVQVAASDAAPQARPVPERLVPADVETLEVQAEDKPPAPVEKPLSVAAPETTAPVSKPAPPAPRAVSSPADWRARVLAHIERHKRYPAQARLYRQQGVAVVGFTLDRTGKVLSRRLVKSSGFPGLDAEAMRVLRAASPLPPPVDDAAEQQEIVVAIEFFME